MWWRYLTVCSKTVALSILASIPGTTDFSFRHAFFKRDLEWLDDCKKNYFPKILSATRSVLRMQVYALSMLALRVTRRLMPSTYFAWQKMPAVPY